MLNLKEQITNLLKLQKIDSEIYALRMEGELCPERIRMLAASFEEKKKNLTLLEKGYLDLQKQKKERELDIGSKEAGSKKLQEQLFKLKTNKEYQTMLQQMQAAKADISVIEDKILELMEEMDNTKLEIDKEKQKLQEEEKAHNQQKQGIEGRIKEIDERIGQLDAQRKQVIPDIESKLRAQYERILTNRAGLAIAAVKSSSCGGCNMFVTPQKINLVKMYDNVITCEMCNRILYLEEEIS